MKKILVKSTFPSNNQVCRNDYCQHHEKAQSVTVHFFPFLLIFQKDKNIITLFCTLSTRKPGGLGRTWAKAAKYPLTVNHFLYLVNLLLYFINKTLYFYRPFPCPKVQVFRPKVPEKPIENTLIFG